MSKQPLHVRPRLRRRRHPHLPVVFSQQTQCSFCRQLASHLSEVGDSLADPLRVRCRPDTDYEFIVPPWPETGYSGLHLVRQRGTAARLAQPRYQR